MHVHIYAYKSMYNMYICIMRDACRLYRQLKFEPAPAPLRERDAPNHSATAPLRRCRRRAHSPGIICQARIPLGSCARKQSVAARGRRWWARALFNIVQ